MHVKETRRKVITLEKINVFRTTWYIIHDVQGLNQVTYINGLVGKHENMGLKPHKKNSLL